MSSNVSQCYGNSASGCMRINTGADPGRGGGSPGGQDPPPPPFWRTPKLHKEGKNVARMHTNGSHFST